MLRYFYNIVTQILKHDSPYINYRSISSLSFYYIEYLHYFYRVLDSTSIFILFRHSTEKTDTVIFFIVINLQLKVFTALELLSYAARSCSMITRLTRNSLSRVVRVNLEAEMFDFYVYFDSHHCDVLINEINKNLISE